MHGRLAVGAYFFLHGVVSSSWLHAFAMVTGRIAVDPHNLGEGLTVGLVVLLSVALVPVGMPLGAWLIGRWDARRVSIGAAVTSSLVVGGSVFAGSVGVLAAAMVTLGLANGILFVAMNTLAAGIERATGRLVLPWCHGWLALGGLIGGGLAAELVWARVPQIDRLLWTAAVGLVLAVGFARLLPEVDLPDTRPRMPRNFVLLTVVAFAALVAADVIRTAPWRLDAMTTSLPPSSSGVIGGQFFALGMALGGFAGGLVAARIGVRNLVNVSAGVTALGIVWLTLSSALEVAVVGFLVTGAGLACLFPVVLGLAAKEGSARHAIAAVAAIGYVAVQVGSRVFDLLGYFLALPYSPAYLLLVPVVVAVAGGVLVPSDRAGT